MVLEPARSLGGAGRERGEQNRRRGEESGNRLPGAVHRGLHGVPAKDGGPSIPRTVVRAARMSRVRILTRTALFTCVVLVTFLAVFFAGLFLGRGWSARRTSESSAPVVE